MSEPLSPNEKAATFIDWTPRFCEGYRIELIDGWLCDLCETRFAQKPQHRHQCGDCPDMTKPENYMRALEACGYRFSIARDYPALVENGLAYVCNIESTTYIAEGWYQTAGEAVIAAFAALYDTEHPK